MRENSKRADRAMNDLSGSEYSGNSFNENAPEMGEQEQKRRGLISRLIVLLILSWIGGFAIFAFIKSKAPISAQPIVSPFKPWDGVWKGVLTIDRSVMDTMFTSQKTIYREFHHIVADKEFRQEGHFELIDPVTGNRENEGLVNIADVELKSLRRRTIRKMGQETSELVGRQENGSLIWSRSMPGVSETFREWVEGDDSFLDGTGIYGSGETTENVRYIGKFHRVTGGKKSEEKSAK